MGFRGGVERIDVSLLGSPRFPFAHRRRPLCERADAASLRTAQRTRSRGDGDVGCATGVDRLREGERELENELSSPEHVRERGFP